MEVGRDLEGVAEGILLVGGDLEIQILLLLGEFSVGASQNAVAHRLGVGQSQGRQSREEKSLSEHDGGGGGGRDD